MQLCPQSASTWSGNPKHPSKHRDLVLRPVARLGLLPCVGDLSSRYGNRLGRHVHAAYKSAHSVTAELRESIRGLESGSTEYFTEAPEAYGIHIGGRTTLCTS